MAFLRVLGFEENTKEKKGGEDDRGRRWLVGERRSDARDSWCLIGKIWPRVYTVLLEGFELEKEERRGGGAVIGGISGSLENRGEWLAWQHLSEKLDGALGIDGR